MTPYESGTGVVAGILGASALAVAASADHLATGINRDATPASLIVVLALVSVTVAGMSVVLPGIWRLACLTVATVPLLWILAAVASTA